MNKTPVSKPSLITLLLAIRDGGQTKKSERALLNALALRCNPDKNFVCWPSYATLADDTGLDERTLKRAAEKLESSSFIKRVVRRNQSNRFFLCFDKLASQAEAAKEEKRRKKEDELRREAAELGLPMLNVEDLDDDSDGDLTDGFIKGVKHA